jgi:hypothetical protein
MRRRTAQALYEIETAFSREYANERRLREIGAIG